MKSVHPNSVAAYWEGRIDLFGKRHQQVLRTLRAARGPMTDREVMIGLGFGDPNSVRPRITELIDAGVVVEVDSVECPATRKRVRRVKAATRTVQAEFALGDVLTPAVLENLNQRAS